MNTDVTSKEFSSDFRKVQNFIIKEKCASEITYIQHLGMLKFSRK